MPVGSSQSDPATARTRLQHAALSFQVKLQAFTTSKCHNKEGLSTRGKFALLSDTEFQTQNFHPPQSSSMPCEACSVMSLPALKKD